MAIKKKKSPARKRVSKRKVVKPRKVKRVVKKKQPARKSVAKKSSAKKKAAPKFLKKNIIGIVTHYFPKVRAAVVKLKAPLTVGDTVRIKGHTTDFVQTVNSMQIDHIPLGTAKKGDEIGLMVNSRVRGNDMVVKP